MSSLGEERQEQQAVLPLESTTCILTMNHDVGSSGSMEGTIMAEIFSQSVEKHKLKYSRFIGDGDTNIFRVVSESKPSYIYIYGEDVTIQKIECVGHVQKWLGTRLRKLKHSQSIQEGSKTVRWESTRG